MWPPTVKDRAGNDRSYVRCLRGFPLPNVNEDDLTYSAFMLGVNGVPQLGFKQDVQVFA